MIFMLSSGTLQQQDSLFNLIAVTSAENKQRHGNKTFFFLSYQSGSMRGCVREYEECYTQERKHTNKQKQRPQLLHIITAH